MITKSEKKKQRDYLKYVEEFTAAGTGSSKHFVVPFVFSEKSVCEVCRGN